MSCYLGHPNRTCVCHCPNMFGVRLQVKASAGLTDYSQVTIWAKSDIAGYHTHTFRPLKSKTGFQRDRITDWKSSLCFEGSSNYQLEFQPWQHCAVTVSYHALATSKLLSKIYKEFTPLTSSSCGIVSRLLIVNKRDWIWQTKMFENQINFV